MHILIVDDENLARMRLTRIIDAMPDCEVVGEAASGLEALEKIEQYDPDLVLLDVRMPGEDGLWVAEQLNDMVEPPAVVFCTAFDEYALDAFNTLAVGYLVKPVQQDQLQAVIEKASKLNKVQKNKAFSDAQGGPHDSARKHISAKTRRGVELIPIDSIYCFVADQKYVSVIHAEGETLVDDTLKELEDELCGQFVRVHRNSLVAINKIEALERVEAGQTRLRLKGTDYSPSISRRHLPLVKQLLLKL